MNTLTNCWRCSMLRELTDDARCPKCNLDLSDSLTGVNQLRKTIDRITAENARLRALLTDAVDSFAAMETDLRRLEGEQDTDRLRAEVGIAAAFAGLWKSRHEEVLNESEGDDA